MIASLPRLRRPMGYRVTELRLLGGLEIEEMPGLMSSSAATVSDSGALRAPGSRTNVPTEAGAAQEYAHVRR